MVEENRYCADRLVNRKEGWVFAFEENADQRFVPTVEKCLNCFDEQLQETYIVSHLDTSDRINVHPFRIV